MNGSVVLNSAISYDVVGRYSQDEINGFRDELIERMLDLADLEHSERVLDAMGGDGNLTSRILTFCEQRGFSTPELVVLEFSEVQKTFAEAALSNSGVKIIQGDVLTMTDLLTGDPLPSESFDRVLIKSALHEIPLDSQPQLHKAVMRVLRPGGLYVTLGFVFDDLAERDEFRDITRCKDRLAGLEMAVVNRHFLTRAEFYSCLEEVGFKDIRAGERFEYRIHSTAAARYYFSRPGLEEATMELQKSQLMALNMRRKGTVRFEGEHSVMTPPGEITIARKPTQAEFNLEIFNRYPYLFVRHLECHADLMDRMARTVSPGSSVLDVACGPGFLAERLAPLDVTYRGIDLNPEFISGCQDRLGQQPNFRFAVADMNQADFGVETLDVAVLSNCLHLASVEPVKVLRKCIAALKPGGHLIVSGPSSPDGFVKAEPHIRAQLERDGLFEGNERLFDSIREANARLLKEHGNYWSPEGMVALLSELGCQAIDGLDNRIYYGFGFIVVARK